MHQMELAKGAKKIVEVCAGVKCGEQVLVLTDTGISPGIGEALAIAVKGLGGEPTLMTTSPGAKAGEEPNPIVAGAMAAADVVISPTTRTIYHTEAASRTLRNGGRIVSLTEISEKILVSGGIEADFLALQPRVAYVKELFENGGKVHVTTVAGTDLHLNITGRPAHACSGLCAPGMKIGIPELEVFAAPIEDETNGILVVDACTSSIGLMQESMRLTIQNGRVTEILGGREASKLKEILNEAEDSGSACIAEFAVGLNDKAKVTGDIIEDEGAYGTGHFALGNNLHFGGKNYAAIHLDMVYWHPTIEIDGNLIMKDGVLIAEPAVD